MLDRCAVLSVASLRFEQFELAEQDVRERRPSASTLNSLELQERKSFRFSFGCVEIFSMILLGRPWPRWRWDGWS